MSSYSPNSIDGIIKSSNIVVGRMSHFCDNQETKYDCCMIALIPFWYYTESLFSIYLN